jgi:hypothetical protein
MEYKLNKEKNNFRYMDCINKKSKQCPSTKKINLTTLEETITPHSKSCRLAKNMKFEDGKIDLEENDPNFIDQTNTNANEIKYVDYEKIYLKEKIEWMGKLHEKELDIKDKEHKIAYFNDKVNEYIQTIKNQQEKIEELLKKLESKEKENKEIKEEITKINPFSITLSSISNKSQNSFFPIKLAEISLTPSKSRENIISETSIASFKSNEK